MRQFHSAFQPSNERSIMDQGRQIPSSSTASALKPTVSGSTNVLPVNCAFRSCDQNRFAINKVLSIVLW